MRLKTYRAHPEWKSGDPKGGRASRTTVGLLPRLDVVATAVRHIGKESNRLDEEEAGLIADPREVYVEYRERWEWDQMRLRLQALALDKGGIRKLARDLGLPERTLRSNLNSGRKPRPASLGTLRDALRSRDRA